MNGCTYRHSGETECASSDTHLSLLSIYTDACHTRGESAIPECSLAISSPRSYPAPTLHLSHAPASPACVLKNIKVSDVPTGISASALTGWLSDFWFSIFEATRVIIWQLWFMSKGYSPVPLHAQTSFSLTRLYIFFKGEGYISLVSLSS